VTAYAKRLNVEHVPGGYAAWVDRLPHDWPEPDRVCLVCHDIVPLGSGTYHADIRALSHGGPCGDVIDQNERDTSRTSRGRWRRPTEVFKVSNGARCCSCAARS
jgi:hypothetical protein